MNYLYILNVHTNIPSACSTEGRMETKRNSSIALTFTAYRLRDAPTV